MDMRRAGSWLLLVTLATLALLACRNETVQKPTPTTATSTPSARVDPPAPALASAAAREPALMPATIDSSPRPIGPYELPFLGKRNVYFVVPSSRAKPQRLVANLHGMCNPPGYACGLWKNAASQIGFLVCPTGNASCGPAMYDAPTWTESVPKMDEDLERAIAVVMEQYPDEVSREAAVLTGFSRGAFAAPEIAKMHAGRWPFLVLNEANVALDARALRKAGVRAVALIAGEKGSNVPGNRATVAQLTKAGFPARLWIMPGAGHYYSNDIDQIMTDAIAWVTANGGGGEGGDAGVERADGGDGRDGG